MFNTESKLVYSSRTTSVSGTHEHLDIRASRGVYTCIYNGVHTTIPKHSIYNLIAAHSKYLGVFCCISTRIYTPSTATSCITNFDTNSLSNVLIIGRPDFKTHAAIQDHTYFTYIDISDIDIVAFAHHYGISLIRKIPIVIVDGVYIRN